MKHSYHTNLPIGALDAWYNSNCHLDVRLWETGVGSTTCTNTWLHGLDLLDCIGHTSICGRAKKSMKAFAVQRYTSIYQTLYHLLFSIFGSSQT